MVVHNGGIQLAVKDDEAEEGLLEDHLYVYYIHDLSFLFLQVTPGHIKGDWGTYGGPILWFIAVFVLPFGLPKFKWKEIF